MNKQPTQSTSALWARFRFSVVGTLLSAPPARGEPKTALESLAAKTWTHPVTRREVHFAAKTIERWLYLARQERDDPVGGLRRAVRKDCGQVSLKPDLIECLANQYHDYPHWTYQLHYDNLKALTAARARGRMGGRKPLDPKQPRVQMAKAMYRDTSMEVKDICTTLKISGSTLYRYVEIGNVKGTEASAA